MIPRKAFTRAESGGRYYGDISQKGAVCLSAAAQCDRTISLVLDTVVKDDWKGYDA